MGQFSAARRFGWMSSSVQGTWGTDSPPAPLMPSIIWLELKATDENGKIIFWSGQIEAEDGNGPVDPGAHFYRAYMLDEHGNLDQ